MINRSLAAGMALPVLLLVLSGCGRDQPAHDTATDVPGQPQMTGTQAPAEAAPPAELALHQPWTRAVPPNAPVAAGYLTLINGTQVDDRLMEIRSDAAERVEIHEMVSAGDGTMQMREVEGGLPLPGGISVDLRPGGLHLMFFGPDTARWQVGESIPVTLVFEGVGEREVQMEVYAPGEAPADGALRMRGPDADAAHEHHEGMGHGPSEAGASDAAEDVGDHHDHDGH